MRTSEQERESERAREREIDQTSQLSEVLEMSH